VVSFFSRIILLICVYLPLSALSNDKWFAVQGGKWVPDRNQLHTLEIDLKNYVSQQAALHHVYLRPWETYKFQYQGQKNDQQKVIIINAFCNDFGFVDFLSQWLVVKDGGNCFFRLNYLPDAHSFTDLSLNGDA